ISTISPEASLISPQRIGEINEVIKSRNREIRIVGDGVKELTPIIDEVTLTVPIAEGCLGECSYCIVRLARGKLKSRREEEIIKVIKRSVEEGVREIRLTAQDTAAYGLDIGTDLTKLLRRILEIHGKYLLRIGMMTPNNAINIIDDLMEIYEDDRIYKFIHIPLQSGDNDILKLMNRRYSVEEYKEIVNKFRRKFPKGFITTDIISGFPMESEEAHKNTMKILWETMPDKVNAAKYTPRPHTKAAALPQIPDKIKSMRCKEVMEISRRIALERNRMHLGEEAEVLILKRGEEDVFKARMKNYRMVLINACEKMMGERAIARIVDAKPTHLIGVLTSSWSW
ncbi:MAG: tRNA (N(6)-L-threonylcarbamoyladenosine(37)-C(2))-methylthiotransferase, partial [Candidatus Methanomethylicia archaeon]